jgi:predicted HTH domain antitoxin
MHSIQLELEEDLMALLHQSNLPVEQAAKELMVMELYRRGTISSGKAAELLDLSRWDFIARAGQLGIPYFDMTDDEWEAECRRSQDL